MNTKQIPFRKHLRSERHTKRARARSVYSHPARDLLDTASQSQNFDIGPLDTASQSQNFDIDPLDTAGTII